MSRNLFHLMSTALARSRYSQGKGRTQLAGEVVDRDAWGSIIASVKIYSRPKTEGIIIQLHEPKLETIIIDLTENDVSIKIRKYPERNFRKMGISEFLEGNYDPDDTYDPENIDDTKYNKVHIRIGHSLDHKIFRPKTWVVRG